MEIKKLTLNQFDITGKKQKIDFNEILKYKKLEEVSIKNCEITNETINKINILENIKRITFINCILNITTKLPRTESLRLYNCKNVYKIT